MKCLLPFKLLVWVLLSPLLAQGQAPPSIHSPAAYFPADQARFQPGVQAPAGLSPAGTHTLKPGVAVFGWVPAWMPESYVRQIDFKLLSHVAYDGYQATEPGQLQAPATGNPADLAGLVHQANPQGRVLLGVGYQEPAAGAALFGPAGAAARQDLAQAVARQVGALGADGVHLDLAFRAQPTLAPTARAASKSEQASADKRLDKTRKNLNDRAKTIKQTTETLQHVRNGFAKDQKAGKPIAAVNAKAYQDMQQRQQADSTQFIQERTRFRAEEAALKNGQVLSAGSTDGRPAAVLELLAALRKALPQATLTLGLPAVDSARVHAGVLGLSPPVDVYVLQAFDYTAGYQQLTPGPLAPLQPAGGGAALASSVDYYLKQGIRPAQLVVGLASLGKVWTEYNDGAMPVGPPAPFRYWYLTSRTLAAWPPRSQMPDAASSSTLLALPPPPDSIRGTLLKAPYKAWADDTASLAARYQWVLRRGLGGVGIWALGFDAPDAPLWSYVRAHLATATSTVAAVDTAAVETAPPAPLAIEKAKPDTLTSAEDQTPLDALEGFGNWVERSELARVVVLGLVVLLAGAWIGMVVGAVRTARYWMPFARRLTWMLTLLLSVAALLGLYVSVVGHFRPHSLWVAWLTALALLLAIWAVYRRSRPAYPLP
jgi:hypothetical protein